MNICPQCGSSHKNSRFCSHSCRAKYVNKGRVHSDETRRKMSESAKVSNVETLEKIHERKRNEPPTIHTYHIKALRYYGERCYCCGTAENLQVHHVTGDHRSHDYWNLLVLCAHCHNTIAHTREYKTITGTVGQGSGGNAVARIGINEEFRDRILAERGRYVDSDGDVVLYGLKERQAGDVATPSDVPSAADAPTADETGESPQQEETVK